PVQEADSVGSRERSLNDAVGAPLSITVQAQARFGEKFDGIQDIVAKFPTQEVGPGGIVVGHLVLGRPTLGMNEVQRQLLWEQGALDSVHECLGSMSCGNVDIRQLADALHLGACLPEEADILLVQQLTGELPELVRQLVSPAAKQR